MAKDDRAKVKMTVIQFETESDNVTLLENIRSITQTLTKALAPAPRFALASIQPAPSGTDPSIQAFSEIEEEEDAPQRVAQPTATTSMKNGVARQYRTPKPIDLDLSSGSVPLKTFMDKAKPEGDIKRYLAITYWLKTYLQIEEISMDHAYTCYRHMGTGWQVPADASKPFRQMKSKTYGWMKSGSSRGSFVINHLGENEARKMINE